MVTPVDAVVDTAVGSAPVGIGRDVDEVFLALVCDDDELLRAEFDAIIGAGWPPSPAPGPPRRDGPPGGSHVEQGRRAETDRAVRRPGAAADPGRERSPPGRVR